MYLCVEFESADSQVHTCETLISSDGVDLNKMVLPDGRAYCSIRLIVVEIKGFLRIKEFTLYKCMLVSFV